MAKDEVAYQPGQVLAGKYKVERVLGVGGFGAVLAATHIHLEERVAIKVLLPEAAKNPQAAERFLREAKASVRIRSEHVARVSDVGTLEDGVPFMVMEYLDGRDLQQVVKASGGQRIDDVAEWMLQACEAIAEAHKLGIIHRDLKPANLFLTHKVDGTPCVKVLDFGISKLTNETGDKGMTKTSDIMGSPFYMSPEQMRSTREVDARSDIWALGAIVFELTAGAPPFDGETMTALVVSIMQEPPRELLHYRSDVPPGLRDVILRCLEKDRNRRFPDVASLAEALMPFAPARAQGSMSRVMAISGRTSQPLTGVVSSAPGPTLVSAPPSGAQAPAPTQVGGDTLAALPPASEAMRPSGGAMSATAGAQSWSGTLATTRKPPSKLPLVVGVGALAIAALGAGGFVMLRSPADKPSSGSVVHAALTQTAVEAAASPLSSSPTVVPVDATATAAATAKSFAGGASGRPLPSATASAAPTVGASAAPPPSATAPTPVAKPTATTQPTATSKAPNDVWNNPD